MSLSDSSPITSATHKLALNNIPLKSQFLIGLSSAYDESVDTILGLRSLASSVASGFPVPIRYSSFPYPSKLFELLVIWSALIGS